MCREKRERRSRGFLEKTLIQSTSGSSPLLALFILHAQIWDYFSTPSQTNKEGEEEEKEKNKEEAIEIETDT